MKVGICGNFGSEVDKPNGQTVKTMNLYKEFKNFYGEDNVLNLNSKEWKSKPFIFLKNAFRLLKFSDHIFLMFGWNGLHYLVPFFAFLNLFFRKKIYYMTIGGWTDQAVGKYPVVKKALNSFNHIFVETEALKIKLEKLGINNISKLNNFKNNKPLNYDELVYNFTEPLPLCIFSRVIEEKGITDAIEAVSKINEQSIRFVLDIYGPIGESYKSKFTSLLQENNEFVEYKGVIEPTDSIDIIKNYFFLLFPTRFKTEGIPSTIIDAYFSGVPIIASDWEASKELIIDGETGYIYNFGDLEEFRKILEKTNVNEDYKKMKLAALSQSKYFEPEFVFSILNRYVS